MDTYSRRSSWSENTKDVFEAFREHAVAAMQSKAATGGSGGRHVRWDGLCVPVRNEQAAVHGVDCAE